MSFRLVEVDPQGGPITGTGLVPCHWKNHSISGPISLANDNQSGGRSTCHLNRQQPPQVTRSNINATKILVT
jgi:hypothetical protein